MKIIEKIGIVLLLIGAAIGLWIAEIAIGMLIAWPISYIFNIEYGFTAVITILIIKFISGLGGEPRGPNEKCTECNRRIQSPKAQKCEMCGGNIKITENEQEKLESITNKKLN